jgi:hypothetical protein
MQEDSGREGGERGSMRGAGGTDRGAGGMLQPSHHSQTQSGSDQSKRSEESSQRARLGGIKRTMACVQPHCGDCRCLLASSLPAAPSGDARPALAATHGSSESTEARWRFVLSSHGVRGVCHGTPCLLLSPALSHTQYTESPDARRTLQPSATAFGVAFFFLALPPPVSAQSQACRAAGQLESPGKRARGTPTHRHRRRGRSPHEQGRRRRAQRAKRPGSRTASRRHGESLASPPEINRQFEFQNQRRASTAPTARLERDAARLRSSAADAPRACWHPRQRTPRSHWTSACRRRCSANTLSRTCLPTSTSCKSASGDSGT